MVGHTITPDGHRRARSAAGLRRGPGAGLHLDRPSPLPVVRAHGPDRGGHPVRPRRRGVVDLRRLVAGGRRRGLRRERGAPLAGRPRRAAAVGRRRVRRRRLGRQPQRPRRRSTRLASRAGHPNGRASGPLILASSGGPQLDRGRREGDGRRRRRACRSTTHGRLTRAGLRDRARRAARRTTGRVGRRGGARPARPTPGIVDDLAGIGDDRPATTGIWFHVDAAYGGGALRRAERPLPLRGHRAGRQPRDRPAQVVVRPVRLRSAAVPATRRIARATFTQHAEYLDTLTERPEWNPSDYAYHLTRRARGLPFWFSLATHGTRAYADGGRGHARG